MGCPCFFQIFKEHAATVGDKREFYAKGLMFVKNPAGPGRGIQAHGGRRVDVKSLNCPRRDRLC